MTTNKRPQEGGTAIRLEERLAFLRITEADAAIVKELGPAMLKAVPAALDELYEHLLTTDAISHLLKDRKTISRLKKAQLAYYERLLGGEWDQGYLDERLHIGRVHARIGVSPQWYLGAYTAVLTTWMPSIVDALEGDSEKLFGALTALIKIVFFDITTAIDAYIEARADAQQGLLNEFTDALKTYTGSLDDATTEISDTTTLQAEATERQASAVAQIATAMAELTQTAKQALGQAEGVMQITEHTIEVARDGKDAVTQVSSGMDEIRQQMETLSERILLLNEQTEQIGDIISSVSEISEQSKLLALNAAIEAARAGEHGRGFAVVATEIRNLADQSKQSTLQVRNILGDIKKATNAAVLATEQGTRSVERGATLAQTAGERFHELADAVEESGDSARLIATISRQQGEGVQQISDAMDDINTNTAQTSAGMKSISESAAGLNAIADSMRSVLHTFLARDTESVPAGNTPDSDLVDA